MTGTQTQTKTQTQTRTTGVTTIALLVLRTGELKNRMSSAAVTTGTLRDKTLFVFNQKVAISFFLFLHEYLCHGFLLEAPQYDVSNYYP